VFFSSSVWQNRTNFSWWSCALSENTSKLCISGFALVCKSGAPPFGHGWILPALKAERWSFWADVCLCMCACVWGVAPSEHSHMNHVILTAVWRECASARHLSHGGHGEPSTGWLSAERQWLCAAEKGRRCLLVSLSTVTRLSVLKPPGSPSSQGGGFPCERVKADRGPDRRRPASLGFNYDLCLAGTSCSRSYMINTCGPNREENKCRLWKCF